VAEVSNVEIDEINILNASILAMHRALDKLTVRPQFVIVDGNKFKKYRDVPHQTIVKGDGKYMSIAAASVLAKTYRDDLMKQLHNEFPDYNWAKNKGYPTVEHRKAIERVGATKYHRMTFQLVDPQLSFDFGE
jgi:ribonuclease HII